MKKFFRCEVCGNIVGLVNEGGGTLTCCGQPMKLLEPNTKDAALEKHVPAYKLDGSTLTVTVGEVLHPMTQEHYIQWIAVYQNKHMQRTELTPDGKPEAVFTIDADEPFTVFEYCNLHGLWKADSK